MIDVECDDKIVDERINQLIIVLVEIQRFKVRQTRSKCTN